MAFNTYNSETFAKIMYTNKFDEDMLIPSPSSTSSNERNSSPHPISKQNMPKYAQLLSVIEDMGKEVRSAYAGNKTSVERLKKGIVHAKYLVGECLMEAERSARQ